jgi:hypothetical protein
VTSFGRHLDHLIRPQQERPWDGQAQRLGGLEVDAPHPAGPGFPYLTRSYSAVPVW